MRFESQVIALGGLHVQRTCYERSAHDRGLLLSVLAPRFGMGEVRTEAAQAERPLQFNYWFFTACNAA